MRWGKTVAITPTRKCTSQGVGGRGRGTKVAMSTMNKNKRNLMGRY